MHPSPHASNLQPSRPSSPHAGPTAAPYSSTTPQPASPAPAAHPAGTSHPAASVQPPNSGRQIHPSPSSTHKGRTPVVVARPSYSKVAARAGANTGPPLRAPLYVHHERITPHVMEGWASFPDRSRPLDFYIADSAWFAGNACGSLLLTPLAELVKDTFCSTMAPVLQLGVNQVQAGTQVSCRWLALPPGAGGGAWGHYVASVTMQDEWRQRVVQHLESPAGFGALTVRVAERQNSLVPAYLCTHQPSSFKSALSVIRVQTGKVYPPGVVGQMLAHTTAKIEKVYWVGKCVPACGGGVMLSGAVPPFPPGAVPPYPEQAAAPDSSLPLWAAEGFGEGRFQYLALVLCRPTSLPNIISLEAPGARAALTLQLSRAPYHLRGPQKPPTQGISAAVAQVGGAEVGGVGGKGTAGLSATVATKVAPAATAVGTVADTATATAATTAPTTSAATTVPATAATAVGTVADTATATAATTAPTTSAATTVPATAATAVGTVADRAMAGGAEQVAALERVTAGLQAVAVGVAAGGAEQVTALGKFAAGQQAPGQTAAATTVSVGGTAGLAAAQDHSPTGAAAAQHTSSNTAVGEAVENSGLVVALGGAARDRSPASAVAGQQTPGRDGKGMEVDAAWGSGRGGKRGAGELVEARPSAKLQHRLQGAAPFGQPSRFTVLEVGAGETQGEAAHGTGVVQFKGLGSSCRSLAPGVLVDRLQARVSRALRPHVKSFLRSSGKPQAWEGSVVERAVMLWWGSLQQDVEGIQVLAEHGGAITNFPTHLGGVVAELEGEVARGKRDAATLQPFPPLWTWDQLSSVDAPARVAWVVREHAGLMESAAEELSYPSEVAQALVPYVARYMVEFSAARKCDMYRTDLQTAVEAAHLIAQGEDAKGEEMGEEGGGGAQFGAEGSEGAGLEGPTSMIDE